MLNNVKIGGTVLLNNFDVKRISEKNLRYNKGTGLNKLLFTEYSSIKFGPVKLLAFKNHFTKIEAIPSLNIHSIINVRKSTHNVLEQT